MKKLREELGLVVKCFGDIQAPPKGLTSPKPVPPGPVPAPTPIAVPTRDPARRPHDGSRTRVEARIAFPEPGEEPEEISTPTRKFSLYEVTSGLPDDSREEDERVEARRLRDLRGRVKAARAVVASTPGRTEPLARDWQRAAAFYSKFGISEMMHRYGVARGTVVSITVPFVKSTPTPSPTRRTRHVRERLRLGFVG